MDKFDITDFTLPPANYEIILKNGRVIDRQLGLDDIMDVAIADGKIVAVEKEIKGPCFNVVDCSGKLVIPGFVDAHTHCYGSTHMGLHPDVGGVYGGVPTVVDGGSAGYMTFADFHDRYINTCATDVYAFLHHHPVGQYAHGLGSNVHSEVWDKNLLKVMDWRVVETVDKYRDRIVGIKNRAIDTFIEYKGLPGLENQLKVCEKCGVPYTVHVGEGHGGNLNEKLVDEFTSGLLQLLRPGDIIAHAFTNKLGRLFRADGAFDQLVEKAVKRGVLLDACVGKTNFSVESFKMALERGFKPDIISSDYTWISVQSVNRHMGLNLSRFLALGLPLSDVLAMATINPAKALRLDDRKGSLAIGRPADISVLDILKGDYTFQDYGGGQTFEGGVILSAPITVRAGRLYHVIHNGDVTP